MIRENALPMAKVSQTKKRVLAILSFDNQRLPFSNWGKWKYSIGFIVIFPVLAAFTPTGKAIVQAQLPLPELAQVTHFIPTKNELKTAITSTIQFKEEKNLTPAEKFVKIQNEQQQPLRKNSALAFLPNEIVELPIVGRVADTLKNIKEQKTGWSGKWVEGKSEFRFWSYGDFKLLEDKPYVEVVSLDGIVYIEEYEKGLFADKMHQFIITKAPYDGIYSFEYKEKIDLSKKEIFKKGTPIQFWSRNRKLKTWLADKEAIIREKLSNINQWDKMSQTDEAWWTSVERIRKSINRRFTPITEAESLVEKSAKSKSLQKNAIPYKKLATPSDQGSKAVLGRNIICGSNGGSMNTNPIGNKYMTLIKGTDEPVQLKKFNFHLSENDYKNLQYELSIYNVVAGDIKQSILQNPIRITIPAGTGWIEKDLSAYNIVSQGDIFIVLENKGFASGKRKKKLYFSLSEDHQNYTPILADNRNHKTKIWETAWVMYFDVTGSTDAFGDINKSTKPQGYFGHWGNGKSHFKFWTYGDYKTYSTSPYVEVGDANSMVIIEETKKTTFGTKQYRLVITKAPHGGILVREFQHGKPISWRHGIKEADPLHFWFVNDEFDFFEQGKDKWISETLSKLSFYLEKPQSDKRFQAQSKKDKEWWNTIENHLSFKTKQFQKHPEKQLINESLDAPVPTIKASEIPYKTIVLDKKGNGTKKIGRTKASSTTSGFNGYDAKNYNFGTVLNRNGKKGIIENFNFHIKNTQFNSLTVDLYFFKVDNQEIQHAITERPIRLKFSPKKGWNGLDLSKYKIGVDGKVLVFMDIVDYEALHPGIFFSLSPTHFAYKPKDFFYDNKQLKFWNSSFAWYLKM